MTEETARDRLARQEEEISRLAGRFRELLASVQNVIVGQDRLLEALLIALLCRGHILIEGVPGLAKTLTVTTLSHALALNCQRIQFTPDLLPSDLIGTMVYHPASAEFRSRRGPVFTNMLIADEINRAPAKVQSALLEAMEEQQVTLGEESLPLPQPFMVMATQNPLEHEGTYPLPEAQVDRFMLKAVVGYPDRDEEAEILDRHSGNRPDMPQGDIGEAEISESRAAINDIHIDPRVRDYLLDIVQATRRPQDFNLEALQPLIEHGASPRGSIFLARAARARAFLECRGYVVPDDILSIAHLVLRHRLILSYEAEAEHADSASILQSILDKIPAP